MIKTKKNFKSIFKTFALAFTTLALMLGVFLGNALPQVKAEESSDKLTSYYTAEKLEEIKLGEIQFDDKNFWNKHLLFDITESFSEDSNDDGEFFAIDNVYLGVDEFDGEVVTCYICFYFDGETKTVSYINNEQNYIDTRFIDAEIDYTYKYFVGGDSHEYVYLFINESELFTSETFVINTLSSDDYGTLSWYISEAIEEPTVEPDEPTVEPDEPTVEPDEPTVEPDEPTVEPDEPTVEPDEPTVEPDEPTVEPDEPTDDNTQEDNSSDVVEEEKDGFIEMLGNTTIEVFKLENLSAFSAGILTLGAFVSFILVAGVVIAIIWVSKKR